MTTIINGQTLITIEDYSQLLEHLEDLESQISQVGRAAYARAEDNASEIRVLRQDLKVHGVRIDKLNARLNEQGNILNGISVETTQHVATVGKMTGHLSQSAELLDQVVILVNEQISAEEKRRQELVRSVQQLLAQFKAQAGVLDQAFTAAQAHLLGLTHAEKDGASKIESSVEALREAVLQLQSQTQEDLLQISDALQGFTHARKERAQREAETLSGVLAAQRLIQERLEAIHVKADVLATSGTRQQALQAQRLKDAARQRAWDCNAQAVRLIAYDQRQDALTLLEEAASLARDDVVLQVNLALARGLVGHEDEAIGQMSELSTQTPDSAEVSSALGALYLEHADPGQAVQVLERAAELAPDSAITWLNLGKAHYACGQVLPALAAWQQAQRLEPALIDTEAVICILLDEQALLEARHAS